MYGTNLLNILFFKHLIMQLLDVKRKKKDFAGKHNIDLYKLYKVP